MANPVLKSTETDEEFLARGHIEVPPGVSAAVAADIVRKHMEEEQRASTWRVPGLLKMLYGILPQSTAPLVMTPDDLKREAARTQGIQSLIEDVNDRANEMLKRGVPADEVAKYIEGRAPLTLHDGRIVQNEYFMTMADHVRGGSSAGGPSGNVGSAGAYQPTPAGNVKIDTPVEYNHKFGGLPLDRTIVFNYNRNELRMPDGTPYTAGSGMARAGVNDPTHSNQSWAGSIPPGAYELVINTNGHLGPNYYLKPIPPTNTFGRDGFCNHTAMCATVDKDGKVVPQSHGCITLTADQFKTYFAQVEKMREKGGPLYMMVGTEDQIASVNGLHGRYQNDPKPLRSAEATVPGAPAVQGHTTTAAATTTVVPPKDKAPSPGPLIT